MSILETLLGGAPTPPTAAIGHNGGPSLHDAAFDAGLGFIWQPDRDGHENDSAPGETFSTRWGITQMTWAAAEEHGIVNGPFQTCTQDQCRAIYRANYYNALNCALWAPGVALMLFVDATLTGVGHVARMLQRAVGVNDDGVIGAKTIAAVQAMDPNKLINLLATADEAYLAALANAPKFINGWTRREEACRAQAHQLQSAA
jgi:lysozyme family protein